MITVRKCYRPFADYIITPRIRRVYNTITLNLTLDFAAVLVGMTPLFAKLLQLNAFYNKTTPFFTLPIATSSSLRGVTE